MNRFTRIAALTSGIALVATTAIGLLPAGAATTGTSTDGRVTTRAGVVVRSLPGTTGTAYGTYGYGKVFPITCKVHGAPVDGNDLWYELPGEGPEWVSARYVANVGRVPAYCGTDQRYTGRTTVALSERVAPSTTEARTATLPRGAKISIICKTQARSVGGNDLWYNLTDGRWVAAAYVTNIGAAPGYCVS